MFGACVGVACVAEKRAKIGRVSVENQPFFCNNTLRRLAGCRYTSDTFTSLTLEIDFI